jgi:peptidoglycan/xylan/chitin deacetylase (PgdA/CDA1 family)
MFHTLDNQAADITCPPDVFRGGLAMLHANGHRAIELTEVATRLRQGAALPSKSFVITFDDGYESVYRHAFPVLQEKRMSATVFLTTGHPQGTPGERLPSLNQHPMLTWEQIREMHKGGVSYGAHTLTHPDLTRLPAERLEAEVSGPKAIIQDALGSLVDTFAYPYGFYDDRCRAAVERHFSCACSVKLGLVTDRSDAYTLERVDAYYLRRDGLFGVMLDCRFPWYLRARGIPREARRALRCLLWR